MRIKEMISNLKHSWLLPHNFFLLVSATENVQRTLWRMSMLILAWKGCNIVDSSSNCRMVEACETSIWSSPPTSSPEHSSRELKGEMQMSQVWFFVGWDPNFFLWTNIFKHLLNEVFISEMHLEFSNFSFCCTILCAVSICTVLCKLVSHFKAIVSPSQSDMIFLGFLT